MVPYFPTRILRRRSFRGTIVGALLCALVLGLTGFPVFERLAGKDLSKPFPCMHKACGCRDATSCWKQCCCHTNAQKLAWAKKHGVTPPDFVVAAAAREAKPVANCCQTTKSCCGSVKSCCSPAQPAAKSCCETKVAAEPATKSAVPWNVVVVEDYRQCRGLAPLWLMLGHATDCTVRPLELPAPLAGEWLALSSDRAPRTIAAPDLPPPRV